MNPGGLGVSASSLNIPFQEQSDGTKFVPPNLTFIGQSFIEGNHLEWKTTYDIYDTLSSKDWRPKTKAWLKDFLVQLPRRPSWLKQNSKVTVSLNKIDSILNTILEGGPTVPSTDSGIPIIFLDWQVQWTQHIVPLMLFDWSGTGVSRLKRKGNSPSLDNIHVIRHMQACLFIGLWESKKDIIASYKSQAKHALKHVMTAKNIFVPCSDDTDFRELFRPTSWNGMYRPPYSWSMNCGDSDNSSDSSIEERKSYFPLPKGPGGRTIHNTQCAIIEMISKLGNPKTILETARFLWQSRANTVADEAMRDESLNKWVKTLTVPRESPSEETATSFENAARTLMQESILQGYKLPDSIGFLVNSAGKLECSCKEGGTAGAITQLYSKRIKEPQLRLCLRTLTFAGEKEILPPGEAFASLLVQDALVQGTMSTEGVFTPDPKSLMMRFRAISIAEISKSRTASIGSIVLNELLTLVSEIGLYALEKIPEAKGSMTGGNLAFGFTKNLLEHKDFMNAMNFSWLIFCSDLSEATDSGNKDIARRVLRSYFSDPIFDKIRGLINFCIDLFSSPQWIEDIEKMAINGWLMGSPMTKLVLAICNVICFRLARARTRCELLPLGAFNGDDAIFICHDHDFVVKYLELIKSIGLKTSWPDTFVSVQDRMYIYSEEVGIVPRELYCMPLVASELKAPKLASDILVPRRKLTVPYSKLSGWETSPSGRLSAASIEGSYSHNNPSTEALIKFWFIPVSILAKHRFTGRALPCLETKLGGNGFPLPFYDRKTIYSAIEYLIRNGLRISSSELLAFINAPIEGSSWQEFRGKSPISESQLRLSCKARSLVQPELLTFRQASDEDERIIGSLLLRTGEYLSRDQYLAQLMCLSRYESVFLDEPLEKLFEDEPEQAISDRQVSQDLLPLLLSNEYLDKVIFFATQRNRLNTSRPDLLTRRSTIKVELEAFKLPLALPGEKEETVEPPSVAEKLLDAYSQSDWKSILGLIREYRFPTDPLLWAIARNSPEDADVFTLDGDLTSIMAKYHKKKVTKMSRGIKKSLILAATESCVLRRSIERRRQEMVHYMNHKSKSRQQHWLRQMGHIIDPEPETPVDAKDLLDEEDADPLTRIYEMTKGHKPILLDWGHLRTLYWQLNFELSEEGDSISVTYFTDPLLSLNRDNISVTTRSMESNRRE